MGLTKVTEDIVEAYDSIKDLRSLPEAFQEVNKRLPLVEQTLQDAKTPAEKLKSTDDAKTLEIVLYSCNKKADNLLEIFKTIGKKSKGQYDCSLYRAIIAKQGKQQRVETLMDSILGGLGVLVAHDMFLAEMQRQVEPLAKARGELSEVSPSLADSDLADQPRAPNQYGDDNHQYNLFSSGIQKVAYGHYFEAKGDQNFGMIPSKETKVTEGMPST